MQRRLVLVFLNPQGNRITNIFLSENAFIALLIIMHFKFFCQAKNNNNKFFENYMRIFIKFCFFLHNNKKNFKLKRKMGMLNVRFIFCLHDWSHGWFWTRKM